MYEFPNRFYLLSRPHYNIVVFYIFQSLKQKSTERVYTLFGVDRKAFKHINVLVICRESRRYIHIYHVCVLCVYIHLYSMLEYGGPGYFCWYHVTIWMLLYYKGSVWMTIVHEKAAKKKMILKNISMHNHICVAEMYNINSRSV